MYTYICKGKHNDVLNSKYLTSEQKEMLIGNREMVARADDRKRLSFNKTNVYYSWLGDTVVVTEKVKEIERQINTKHTFSDGTIIEKDEIINW